MTNLSHTIRNFNRFELKYLVTIQEAEVFKKELAAYLIPDDHGDRGGAYRVSNLYYDSPDHTFYWEKVDGLRFRRKLRIRHYETSEPLTASTPVFVEIKQRLNRVTQKRRVLLAYQDALRLCSQYEPPAETLENQNVMDEVIAMGWQHNLQPASVVSYTRQALVGSDYDIGLRVTFDRDLHYSMSSLDLMEDDSGLLLFPPDWMVMEIKVNERIPYWLTEMVARHNFNLIRVSKYCRSIEMGLWGMAQPYPTMLQSRLNVASI